MVDRYAAGYPARFYLFASSGNQIAGDGVSLPKELLERIRHDHIELFDRTQHAPGPPVFLLHRRDPAVYWVGVHIPIRNAAMRGHLHGTAVWRFSSLWTNPSAKLSDLLSSQKRFLSDVAH